MTWGDGSTFKGVWKGDQRKHGEMQFSNGDCYRGGFSDDKLHGPGYLLLASGVIYKGEFDNDCYSAVGKLMYPNGDIYYGQHK